MALLAGNPLADRIGYTGRMNKIRSGTARTPDDIMAELAAARQQLAYAPHAVEQARHALAHAKANLRKANQQANTVKQQVGDLERALTKITRED